MKFIVEEKSIVKDTFELELTDSKMMEINDFFKKELVKFSNSSIEDFSITRKDIFDAFSDSWNSKLLEKISVRHCHDTKESIWTVGSWIQDCCCDCLYAANVRTKTNEFVEWYDNNYWMELENDREYFQWKKEKPKEVEHIYLKVGKKLYPFDTMQKLALYVYEESIHSFEVLHYAYPMRYIEKVESVDRYWLNSRGVPYEELFDENPEMDRE